jgi:hypothetical protein
VQKMVGKVLLSIKHAYCVLLIKHVHCLPRALCTEGLVLYIKPVYCMLLL